ncbi:lipoyl synthase [Alkaliphilus crotonatoxidans]
MEVKRKPDWLRVKLRGGRNLSYVKTVLDKLTLNTVCEAANCPNRAECFSQKTATFMIMGKECTRNCRFCNVTHGKPQPLDPLEPENVATAAVELDLRHVVVTSVTRDDLPYGGADHFARVVGAIKEKNPRMIVEVLIPDLKGDEYSLELVVKARPEIINHNMETVPRLYPQVRPGAIYQRSIDLIKAAKKIDAHIITKSGIMVGLGETEEEVIKVLQDLREVSCDFVTIGQYLPPSQAHYPLQEYVHPDQFERYRKIALTLGFSHVASAPLVRSSYHAAEALESIG